MHHRPRHRVTASFAPSSSGMNVARQLLPMAADYRQMIPSARSPHLGRAQHPRGHHARTPRIWVRTGLLGDGKKVTVQHNSDAIVVTAQPHQRGTSTAAWSHLLDYLQHLPAGRSEDSILPHRRWPLSALGSTTMEGSDIPPYCGLLAARLARRRGGGVNVPNVVCGLPSVTDGDRADIMFGCELGVMPSHVLHPRWLRSQTDATSASRWALRPDLPQRSSTWRQRTS